MVQQTHARASTRSRIPQAGLREMTSATTNSRSGILPPGSIANKATSVSRTQHSTLLRIKTENTDAKLKPPVQRPPMLQNQRSQHPFLAQPQEQRRLIRAATRSPRPRCLALDPRPLARLIPPSPTLTDTDLARPLLCLVPTHPSVPANPTVPRSPGPPPPWIPTPKMEEVYLGNARVCLHLLCFCPVEVFLAPLDHLWNCNRTEWRKFKHSLPQGPGFTQLDSMHVSREAH